MPAKFDGLRQIFPEDQRSSKKNFMCLKSDWGVAFSYSEFIGSSDDFV